MQKRPTTRVKRPTNALQQVKRLTNACKRDVSMPSDTKFLVSLSDTKYEPSRSLRSIRLGGWRCLRGHVNALCCALRQGEEKIKKRGGKVLTSVSKNTSILVVADIFDTTSKIQKAKEFNIPIYLKEEFLTKFNLN